MRRRDQGISNAWSFLLGFVLLTLVVPGVLIGPARAVRIIASAVSGTVLQHGDPEKAEVRTHQLPMVELRAQEKVLVHNGVHHPIDLAAGEGGGVLVHFQAPGNAPFGPYGRIRIAPPRSSDMLGGQLAMWVAGRMGVPVPHTELIYLQRDGKDAGIHVATEDITAHFEAYRNISDGNVPVLRMTHSGEEDRDPWHSVDSWELTEGSDEKAAAMLEDLIGVLGDTLITNAERRTELETMLDVDAFLRFHAAVQMLGITEEADASMALVLSPRTGSFYPVLVHAPMLTGDGATVVSSEWGLLGDRMMAISDWRDRRDQLVRQALEDLHTSGAFGQRLDQLTEQVGPALATTGRSRRPLFSMHDPAHSADALQWSTGDLRSRVTSYWDRLSIMVASTSAATDPILP